MCTKPLKILSRKADKLPVFDKLSYIVPCGHCEECKESKRNGWFVRLYYQFKECESNNGFGLFITLTWNNQNIKKVHGYNCFCIEDVQKYIKRVRSSLVRMFPSMDVAKNVKYATFFEYGGRTHRPHAHMLWFFNSSFPRGLVRNLVAYEWTRYNGFIKYGSQNGGFINGVGGIKYCAKYCAKDVYEDEYVSKLCLKLKNEGVSDEDLKKFYPRPLCSNNLGLYALQCNDISLLEKGFVIMPDKVMTEKCYHLPLYLERKLFYDVKFRVWDNSKKDYLFYRRKSELPECVDYTPVYVLNQKGLAMKMKRLPQYLDAATNVYNVVRLCLPDTEKINVRFHLNFANSSDLHSFIFKDLPEHVFVDYVSVYRGCVPASGRFSTLDFSSTRDEDFQTSLEVRNGITFDRTLLQSFLNNLLYYKNIPDIDLKCDIIYYIYSLAMQSFENEVKEQERQYVDRKTIYLMCTEIV